MNKTFVLRFLTIMGGQTTIGYELHNENGEIERYKYQSKAEIHPEFKILLAGMNRWLAETLYIAEHNYHKVGVNGIKITGYLDKQAVQISGLLQTQGYQNTKIQSEKIPINGDTYKFIEELKVRIDRLAEECKMLIEDGKSAQFKLELYENNEG